MSARIDHRDVGLHLGADSIGEQVPGIRFRGADAGLGRVERHARGADRVSISRPRRCSQSSITAAASGSSSMALVTGTSS